MNVNGRHYRTIWVHEQNSKIIQVIDQRFLPHRLVIEDLKTFAQAVTAIRDMHIRGAGLIGATAAYGIYLAALEAGTTAARSFDLYIRQAARELMQTRPTAVNLAWAVNRQMSSMEQCVTVEEKIVSAFVTAGEITAEDAGYCRKIGEHGLPLIHHISQRKAGAVVNILTHCNAGWLAFVDHGSATAPIYKAHDSGIRVHVWVDETRPRNQGAKLTAWELGQHGVPHTVIADNTGGHLMQHGLVDLVIVGTDRTTRNGDVANKIGTYLKALAAKDNNIPFYVAVPSSSFDWNMADGLKEIPIEERGSEEVKHADGLCNGELMEVLIPPVNSPAANYGFDVTPHRLITGLITERGVCEADINSILQLFPEKN